MTTSLLFAVLVGILFLLLLILYFRIPAFIALLMAGITTGLLAGLDAEAVMSTVQEGMGSTLGFVATVVGLGAMFGAILEKSGGAYQLATAVLKLVGEKRVPLGMSLIGYIVSIPVFCDSGFIILSPLNKALTKKVKQTLGVNISRSIRFKKIL